MLIGRQLGGRYRIEEVIGRGGMGAVYRAVDERLGRQVALKVITAAGTSDADARDRLRARFFREARSAAALPHHPNVVPVYDYGSDEELGLDYLVMELLRGSDLATRLARSGPPPLAASLKILVEAAHGVAVGHRQGLIHRDIKPGNIFLAEAPGNEVQVRVVDFGIAKLADEEDTLSQLTQDGRVPHSPAYASPEQLRGLRQLTPASDVFSLGAVGYQLLTGQRPFSDSDRNRFSLGMPVDPPALRSANPAVPAATEAAVQKALAFDPEARFANAGEMASALEDALRGLADSPIDPYIGGAAITSAADRADSPEDDDDRTRIADFDDDRTLLAPPSGPAAPPPARAASSAPDAAPPPRDPPPPRRPPPQRRRGVGGIIVWGLVLAVLVAAIAWGWSEMQSARTSLADDIPPAPDTMPILAPDVGVDLPGPPTELDALINNQEGVRFFNLGQLDSARVQFERAVRISPENADYRRNYGVTLLRLGLVEEAEQELERAIRLDPGRALPYANLAEAHLARGDTTAAIVALEQHLSRETNPALQGQAERLLRQLRAAQDPPTFPRLLGETIVPDTQPVTPRQPPGAAPDTTL